MESCWLDLFIMILLHPVLAAPPAPVNVHITSNNFRHVLCWEPAPGTAPETVYTISQSVRGTQKWNQISNYTSEKCLKVKLNYRTRSILAVQAFYNSTLSQRSKSITFYPEEQSKIGAPLVSLTSCGNCIKINISVPQTDTDSDIPDIQQLYGASFRVRWRKKHDTKYTDFSRKNRSFTLEYLEKGVEYCVQVQMTTNINKNTESSPWQCIFTSLESHRIDPVVSGAVAGISIGIIFLTVGAFCLFYTGFFCNPKAALPTVLTMTQHGGHTLTLERTVANLITLRSEMVEVRKHNNPTLLSAAATECSSELEDENDEDDDEDGNNTYMNKGSGLSSGQQVSPDMSGEEQPQTSGDSGSLPVRPWAESEDLQEEASWDETTPESSGVSLTNDRVPLGTQVQATDEKDSSSISSHVDLFSVTLASLAEKEKKDEAGEEEEEDCDFSREFSLKPLLFTDLRQTLSDSQTKTGKESLEMPVHFLFEDSTATKYEGYEAKSMLQQEEEEEEEEEEEFSEYLGHK